MASKKRQKSLTDREIAAYTLLGEAAGEGDVGMAAVMNVLKNRVDAGQGSLGYVAQKSAITSSGKRVYQFSTWGEAKKPTAKFNRYGAFMQEALKIVDAVMSGAMPDPTGGALNYYANKGANAIAEPTWFAGAAKAGSVQIGNHIFAARRADRVDLEQYAPMIKAAKEGIPVPVSMSESLARSRSNVAETLARGNTRSISAAPVVGSSSLPEDASWTGPTAGFGSGVTLPDAADFSRPNRKFVDTTFAKENVDQLVDNAVRVGATKSGDKVLYLVTPRPEFFTKNKGENGNLVSYDSISDAELAQWEREQFTVEVSPGGSIKNAILKKLDAVAAAQPQGRSRPPKPGVAQVKPGMSGPVQLPASKAALDAISRAYGGQEPLGGGLVTRKVQTVPVPAQTPNDAYLMRATPSDFDSLIDELSLANIARGPAPVTTDPRSNVQADPVTGRVDNGPRAGNPEPAPAPPPPKTAQIGVRTGVSIVDSRGKVVPAKAAQEVEIGKVYTDKSGQQRVAILDMRSGLAVLVKPQDVQKEMLEQTRDSLFDFAKGTLKVDDTMAWAISRITEPNDSLGQKVRNGLVQKIGQAAAQQLNQKITGAQGQIDAAVKNLYGGAVNTVGGIVTGFNGLLGRIVAAAGNPPPQIQVRTPNVPGPKPPPPQSIIEKPGQAPAKPPPQSIIERPGQAPVVRSNTTELPATNLNIPVGASANTRGGETQVNRTLPIAAKPIAPIGSMPAAPKSANANLINEKLNAQPRIRLVTQTVTVRNPKYRPAGGDKQEKPLGRGNVQPGAVQAAVPVEPEFITKQIQVAVPVKQAAAFKPAPPPTAAGSASRNPYVIGQVYQTGAYQYQLQSNGQFVKVGKNPNSNANKYIGEMGNGGHYASEAGYTSEGKSVAGTFEKDQYGNPGWMF